MENEEDRKTTRKTDRNAGSSHARWVVRVFLMAVSLSAVMNLLSSAALEGADYIAAILVLMIFIGLGVVFDIIGVAVTASDPRPFHSMASHRVKGAKEALNLIRNAEKVSSFCNDVVGDICGIVSGSTGAVIVTLLQGSFGWNELVVSTVVTALVSGLTIGGKAVGKKFAMNKSKDVIYAAAKLLSMLHLGR